MLQFRPGGKRWMADPRGPRATVVGSGPNGLVAALVLARSGWNVTVLEAAGTPGGGLRSAELIRPGVVHDVCSAIHPLALASPALRSLSLADHGLRWVHPEIPLAHPLDHGEAVLLHRDVDATAAGLGPDREAYRRVYAPLVRAGQDLTDGLLSPLRLPPAHPIVMGRFGLSGIRSAEGFGRRRFSTDGGRALFAGLAAHSILALDRLTTAGYGLTLGVLAHTVGWPMAGGGSGRIADALVALIEQHGGQVVCDHRVESLDEIEPSDATLLDLTPRQVITVAGDRMPARYRRRLERYRYGAGVFKVDWVLDGPVPWANEGCSRAATVHVGGSLREIVAAEADVAAGRHPAAPFVLLAQPTLFDQSRSGDGSHTVWAYCHVPNGSSVDMTDPIESQIERFAPGFRDRIVGRHTMGPAQMEAHDANYVGGDINGGSADLRQFLGRPVLGLHPWRTPVDGLYLCSASTPPGGGVHGMCGWHAAREVLKTTPTPPDL